MSNPIYGNTQLYNKLELTDKIKGKVLTGQTSTGTSVFSSKTLSMDENNLLRIGYVLETPELLAVFTEIAAAQTLFTIKMRALFNYLTAFRSDGTIYGLYNILTYLGEGSVEGGKK